MSNYNQLDKRALDAWITRGDDAPPGCPACGEPIDYCQGHGEMGDPAGWAVLHLHIDGNHSRCHPEGCEEASDE